MRPSFPTPQGLQPVCHPSKFLPRIMRIRRKNQVRLSSNWSVILSQWTTRNYWSFRWFSKTPFVRSFPIRQEICDVSQIGKACHGICPPIFIQTWLQQHCRSTFFHSTHCSLGNPICFRSAWCRRTMIPGEIFTWWAEFQGIVSVNDFWFPLRLQELLQASLCFLRSFCFARLRLDPLGGQVLHHDCISMIASRFTTFTENLVICCYQVTNIFCTRYGFAKASSARSPCDCGPLAVLAFSVFREMSFNTVFTPIRTSRRRRRKTVHEKNWRVSLCVQEICHPRDLLWILAAIPVCRNDTSLSVLNRGLRFYLVLDFWLAWSTGLPVLSFSTCILDTDTL